MGTQDTNAQPLPTGSEITKPEADQLDLVWASVQQKRDVYRRLQSQADAARRDLDLEVGKFRALAVDVTEQAAA